MKTKHLVCVCVCGFVCFAGQLLAVDGVWTNTVDGAWTNTVNWKDGVVASGETATAWFTNSPQDKVFVKLPAAGVTVGTVAGSAGKVFTGGPLWLDSATPTLTKGGCYMTELQGTNGLILDGAIDIKTRVSCSGSTVLKSGNSTVWMNHMATSTNALDGNLLSTNALVFAGGLILFQGRPNMVSRSHDWTLTAGETLITRATGNFDSVPGALISGTGIPAGAYLKRIYSTVIYELSQPATLSGLYTLSFSAIPTVETFQRFARIEMTTSGTLSINKQTMPVHVDAGELIGGAAFTFAKQGTGTLAIEKIDAFKGTLELADGPLTLPAQIGPFEGQLNLKGGILTFPSTGSAVTNRLAKVTVTGQAELSIPGASTIVVIDDLDGAGELVKTGAGTLQIKYASSQSQVTVNGGRLLFEAAPPDSASLLLAAAAFHTDANVAESLVCDPPVNGTNFVSQWSDVRTNGITAVAIDSAAKPFVVPNAQNGLSVLDFGSLKTVAVNWNYGGYLEWNVTNSAIRETFVVFSDRPEVTTMYNFFLGDTVKFNFHRGEINGELLDGTYASASLRSGSVSVDMQPVPVPTNTLLSSGFHVISLAATAPVQASTFGRDRLNRFGGIRLGEALVFTNVLSAAQRYTLNHYLWRKWFNNDYVGTVAFRTLRMGAGAILTLGEGTSLTVDSLSLTNGFIKEGSGTLTARHLSGTSLVPETITSETFSFGNGLFVQQGGSLNGDSLTFTNSPLLWASDTKNRVGWIEANALVASGTGTLEVGVLSRKVEQIAVAGATLAFPCEIGRSAWFHVDATVTQSLATVLENGTNFVTRWYDVRTNGIDAGAASMTVNRPYLQTNALNGLPFLDFGRFKMTAQGLAPNLEWNVVCTNLRSAFLVFSDSPGDYSSFLLGDRLTTIHFHRDDTGAGKLFNTTYAAPALQKGLLMVDRDTVTASYVLPAGFHVITLVPTGAVTASAFARDRSNRYGGQRLAEVLVYDRAQPTIVQQAVTDFLLAKWKALYTPRSLGVLRVTDGGAIRCPYDQLNVVTLEGSGTITAAGLQATSVSAGNETGMIGTLTINGGLTLTNGAVVTVDCDGVTCDRMDVAGPLTLGGSGTIQLQCDAQNLNGKTFTLFTFSSIEHPENLAGWSLAGEICTRYTVVLAREGNTIQMTFKGKGSFLFLR